MNFRLLVAILVAFSATSANATLMTADWKALGDGLITVDDRTSLEWLDAPLSLNRSYNDLVGIDGTDEFDAGGDFEGFRLATTAEVKSLFVDTLGIPLTDFAQWVPSSYAPVVLLHSLFGTTSGGDFAEIRSITADAFTSTQHYQSIARICQNGYATVCANENTAAVNTDGGWISDNVGSLVNGAWIVRQGTFSVPEPGTLGLMSLSLVGFAGHRFSRRKKGN